MRYLLAVLLLALSPARAAETHELSVAAAADLSFCLDALDAEFVKANPGAQVKVATGASGNFYAQIQNGAPFDVFLSADMDYPRKLIESGDADAKSLSLYAVGHLALWSTNPAVDPAKGLGVLADPQVKKLAIANPEHAPYGRSARAALQQAGLWDQLQDKIVLGENIAQTAQFVQSGNADAGLVAYSLLKAPKLAGVGRYFMLPEDSYPRLEQGVVITKHGAANPLAPKYLDFLASPAARKVFEQYGFLLPQAPKH
jgi:molybdate transport system substrate-binding protein